MNIVDRFIKYVKVDTTSDPKSETSPSSMKQKVLGEILVEDMKAIGIQDVYMDEYGIVYGTILSNLDHPVDTIGFIAHMDTSPDMSGSNVKPRIVENYDGSDIVLQEEKNIVMHTKEFPMLLKHKGHDLIVTDGTTLLGADDKAGICEILDMCSNIIKNDLPHGEIRIAFTPDEEVGRGTEHFNMDAFHAKYAYTVDGSDINAVEYENFNAASAIVTIQGSSVHPGEAKGKMINASCVAMKFHSLLPVQDDPALTQGYEGFNHLIGMNTSCEHAEMEYIIRNHDETLFQKQKQDFMRACDFLNAQYGNELVKVHIEDTYYNMRKLIEPHMYVVDRVKTAMEEIGLHPVSVPIRGGTDGVMLTYQGLLCPNIGTGCYIFLGKYEFISIQSMIKVSELLTRIVINQAKG